MTWQPVVLDPDYEIYDEYPYPIRRIGSDKVISEWLDAKGYVICKMNSKPYKKHRVIATQFINNDDPDNLTDVDHINHIRDDNHIENLRWTTHRDNSRNISSQRGYQYTFLDELPDTAESLDSYGRHDLDGVFIDYEAEKLYLFNGVRYRELIPTRSKGNLGYRVIDIEDKRTWLAHKVLFG